MQGARWGAVSSLPTLPAPSPCPYPHPPCPGPLLQPWHPTPALLMTLIPGSVRPSSLLTMPPALPQCAADMARLGVPRSSFLGILLQMSPRHRDEWRTACSLALRAGWVLLGQHVTLPRQAGGWPVT